MGEEETARKAAQLEANKVQGKYWEIVAEKTMMKHVNNYQREVPDGGRRIDFEIRKRDGERSALVEVKSGEINNQQQIRDFVDQAATTDHKTLVIAHPNPEEVLKFLERFPEILERCMQKGVNFFIKDLSVLENWKPTRERTADNSKERLSGQEAKKESVPEPRSDTERAWAETKDPHQDARHTERDAREPAKEAGTEPRSDTERAWAETKDPHQDARHTERDARDSAKQTQTEPRSDTERAWAETKDPHQDARKAERDHDEGRREMPSDARPSEREAKVQTAEKDAADRAPRSDGKEAAPSETKPASESAPATDKQAAGGIAPTETGGVTSSLWHNEFHAEGGSGGGHGP